MSMTTTNQSVLLATAACVLCFTPEFAPLSMATDLATRTARSEEDIRASSHNLIELVHVKEHIAFLKIELGITPAQEFLWQSVVTAMCEDVRNLNDADSKVSQKPSPETAIQYLENRVMFADLRAQGEARFLMALRPLYDNLSWHQRQLVDVLLLSRRA